MRMAFRLSCLLLLLTLTGLTGWAAGAATLALNSDGVSPHSRADGTGIQDPVIVEAFRRIGVAVRHDILPSERTLQNSNQGVDDGTYARVAGLESLYPNLIMVPEPVAEVLFSAFTKDPALRIDGWAGLKPHSLGIITGWKIVEANTADVPSRTSVKDEEALLALLDSGRVEVVVVERSTGREFARRMGLKGVRTLDPPLERRPMHLYLHRRHAGLVPQLNEALRQMKRDGAYQRLTRAGMAETGR